MANVPTHRETSTTGAKTMKIKQTIAYWGVPSVAIALAFTASHIIAANKPEDAKVTLANPPATAPSAARLIAGAGLVEPSSELVAVASSVSGIVDAVNVRVGQTVRKGDVLFTLDARSAQAELAQREAAVLAARQQVAEAEVQLEERQASLSLYEGIGDARAMTKEELQRRRFAVETAAARVASARAAVAQAQAAVKATATELARLTVRAPMDATVLRLTARPGQFAPAAQLQEPLATLGRLDPLHVRIDVDEADLSRLSQGAAATVSPRGDSKNKVQAQFVRVEPLVTPKRSLTNAVMERVDTRVLQVIYVLPADAKGFYPGQQVDAFVVAGAAR
jgi:HlyD family secretion protein